MDAMTIIQNSGVIPVLGLKDPETAPRLAQALKKGGYLCWRSPCAPPRPWTA